MVGSRLDTLPSEVQLLIAYYLPIQSLMQWYQASRHCKCIMDNDKWLWRGVYERHFGHEFAKDRWILWAVRRL
jgi:hypothetical protein